MTRAAATGSATLLLLLSLAACTPADGPDEPAGEAPETSAEVVEGTGTVVWRSVEGGLYVIEADDGTTYQPLNLEPRYRVDSLRVSFEGEVRTDMASIHMVGPLLEITGMEELGDSM